MNMVVPAGCQGTVTWRPIESSGAAPAMTTGAQWATKEGTGRRFGPLAESFTIGPFGRYGNVTVVNDVTSLAAVDITTTPSLVGNISIATGLATSAFRLSNNTGSISSTSTTGVIETMLYCTSANNVQLSSPAQAGNLQYTVRNASGVHQFLNGATTLMTIDGTGNAGLGVVPSNAYSAGKVMQIVSGGVTIYGSSTSSIIGNNISLDSSGNTLYQVTAASTMYRQDTGEHKWLTAPSGTAAAASTMTERMRIKNNGQVRFVPLASDPASPENGDVYYNSTTNKLRVYAGGLWVDLH